MERGRLDTSAPQSLLRSQGLTSSLPTHVQTPRIHNCRLLRVGLRGRAAVVQWLPPPPPERLCFVRANNHALASPRVLGLGDDGSSPMMRAPNSHTLHTHRQGLDLSAEEGSDAPPPHPTP
eukprot:359096-Chlamydomonas_euryale.AAC.3